MPDKKPDNPVPGPAPKLERVVTSKRLRKDLLERFNELSARSHPHVTANALIEEAMRQFLEQYEQKEGEG
jgi:hypothetical protein